MAEQSQVENTPEVVEEEFQDAQEPQKPQESGNGNGTRTQVQTAPVMKKITESYMVPMQQTRQSIRQNPLPKMESDKQRTSRQFLEDLISKPEATNYVLAVHRYLPSVTDTGTTVPCGKGQTGIAYPVMHLDDLRLEIIKAWGGGEYKAIVSEEDGSPVAGMPAIMISVPCSMHSPKLKKFEDMNDAFATSVQSSPEEDEHSRQMKEMEQQAKLDLLNERKAQAEQRRTEAEMRAEIRKRELDKLRRDSLGSGNAGNEMLTALQTQMLAMQQQLQQQIKEERDAQEKYRREVETQRREDYERAEKRREDAERLAREERTRIEQIAKEDRARAEQVAKEERARAEQVAKEERTAIEAQLRTDREAAKAALEAAERRAEEERKLTREMFTKLAEKPPDTSMKEFFLAMNQMSAQKEEANSRLLAAKEDSSTKLLAAILPVLTAPKPNGDEKMYEIMKINNEANRNTMEMALRRENKENSTQQQLMNTLMSAVLTPKRDGMGPDMILKLIGEGRSQMKETYELMQGMQGNQEPPPPAADGFDPALGFLGNMGRAIFGGLEGLLKAATQDPRLLEVAAKLLGTRQPTPADMAAYAYREEQRALQGGGTQALPPPVNNPPPVQQQYQQPQPQQQYIQQGMMPPPVRPPMQQSLITPPPVQSAPAPVAPPQQTPPPTEAQLQQAAVDQAAVDVATALEGESAGVNLDGVSNSAPQPVTPSAQATPAPAQTPPQPRQLTPEEQESVDRLRECVSNTIDGAIKDIVDERLAREWHENAHEFWNGQFKRALVGAANNDERVKMIEFYCEPTVWARMRELVASKPDELVKFYDGVNALVDLNKTPPTTAQ